MTIQENVPLSGYSTMGLGGEAAFLTEVSSRMEVLEALSWAQQKQVPVLMIGGGSNIFWRDEGYSGLVIVNKIKGYESYDEDETNTYLTLGSGENWDSVVARSVEAGLSGIECMSLIPGSVGATVIQNVGAYGQEIANTLTVVEAFDTVTKDFVNIPAADCGFGYRFSRFKTVDHGRFFITGITLHLSRIPLQPPFYGALHTYLDAAKITDYSPKSLRQAVITIRQSKLPDPATVRNNGSFFANPIIPESDYAYIASNFDNVPHWSAGSGSVKLSAAWLIEQAGYKDVHDAETGMATWAKQPLVLVNESATSTVQLLAFKQKIVDAVQQRFAITLEQEPELLP